MCSQGSTRERLFACVCLVLVAGTLPAGIESLTAMKYFELDENLLTGDEMIRNAQVVARLGPHPHTKRLVEHIRVNADGEHG